jgi:predicted nuclease with TOPRIM domain
MKLRPFLRSFHSTPSSLDVTDNKNNKLKSENEKLKSEAETKTDKLKSDSDKLKSETETKTDKLRSETDKLKSDSDNLRPEAESDRRKRSFDCRRIKDVSPGRRSMTDQVDLERSSVSDKVRVMILYSSVSFRLLVRISVLFIEFEF